MQSGFGIDFGTSAVRAATCAGGEPQAVVLPDGADELVAAVAFTGGGVQVGRKAAEFSILQPGDVALGLKARLLSGGGDEVVAGQPRSAASLAAAVLQRLVELAAQPVGPACIAHPATENATFDAGLLAAAKQVGLAQAAFVPEPIAAAVRLCGRDHERAVFVVDVGASHVTVAVVDVRGSGRPALRNVASAPVGGDAVTAALVEQLGLAGAGKLGAGMSALVRQSCEQLKRDLATAESASTQLPPFVSQALGCSGELTLQRPQLRGASEALMHALEDCCERARSGALGAGGEVELYVIGGGSRLPFVCPRIEQVLGTRARVARAASVVAQGAAKLAASEPAARPVDDVRTRASWLPQARARPPSAPVVVPAPQPPVVIRPTPVPVIVPPRSSAPPAAAPGAGLRQSMQSVAVSQIDAGHVLNATTPSELLRLPLARALRDADLEPISLPLLLLLTGHKRRTGTLVLQMDGTIPVRVCFVEGRPMLSPPEVNAVCDRFKHAAGSYQFEPDRAEVGTRKEQSALALVVGGLRHVLRSFDEASLRRALQDKLALCPEVSAAQQLRLGNLGLTAMESRLVKFSLNGKNTGQSVIEHSGAGANTTLGLLLLLELYGFLEWKPAEQTTESSLETELAARAKQLEAANYFQVLGVHWSSNGEEIAAAYQKVRAEVAEGTPVFAAAPDACRRIAARIETAYQVLSDHVRRDGYRRATFPDINFEGVEDLLEKKHRALQMKEDASAEARDVQRRLRELARSKRPPRGD